MCMPIDSSGDIPFRSIDLSFNIQLPRYKPLDSTYLEVNGSYFKTKYIITCPQNILLVDLISQSYLPRRSFLNTSCPTHLGFPRLTPY